MKHDAADQRILAHVTERDAGPEAASPGALDALGDEACDEFIRAVQDAIHDLKRLAEIHSSPPFSNRMSIPLMVACSLTLTEMPAETATPEPRTVCQRRPGVETAPQTA